MTDDNIILPDMMKVCHSIFFFALLLAGSGCDIGGEANYISPPSMDVSISYVDEQGKDVLNPEYFSVFNIYYLQKNEETEAFELVEVENNQYSFYTDEESDRYALRIFPNREFIDGESRTIIENHRDDFDTLRVQGYNEGRGSVAERIWYNDELVWETAPNPPRRYFVIIKTDF
ncbi:hypothetical protein [Fodinibius sp. Rm-B-1B1-1]|uniref:hypothetical protein n=1 Tax=Fodinibius alkaliphilus TaxID=3140241 RepID=UPI003159AFA7